MTEELTPEELAFVTETFDLARGGDLAGLVEHLDAGVPVDLTNGAGDTLLLLAAYHRRGEVVHELLARGADHARVNDNGQTALAAAVFRQEGPLVTALLAAGADPDLGARSAVVVATYFGLADMLALLGRPGGQS